MPVGAPGDTEVVPAERPMLSTPVVGSPVPLEQPLDPDKYVCGRGDIFELNFWGAQNFKLRVPIDSEGRTFISKVGYVELSGRTLRDARETVRKVVLRYFPGLSFDMSLVEMRTFLVHVVDNVGHPGAYPARAVDRVSAVLQRAGGVTGSKRRIHILRHNGKEMTADLLRYTLTGDTKYDPTVLDGDVIRVPFEGLVATIGGAVNRSGRFELVESRDLAELLDLGGGLADSATHQLPLRLVRKDNADRDALTDIPFTDPLPTLPLQTEDTVLVPSRIELQRSVLIVGAIMGATADDATATRRIGYVQGDTVRTVLERIGGVLPGADLSAALLRPDSGGPDMPVDLEALLVRRDFSADRPMHIGDTLFVPHKRRSVIVEGAIFRPGSYPFNPKYAVEQYVAGAGGPTRFAQGTEEIQVIAQGGAVRRFAPGLAINPGDTVVVPERNFSRSETVQLIISGIGLVLGGVAVILAARH